MYHVIFNLSHIHMYTYMHVYVQLVHVHVVNLAGSHAYKERTRDYRGLCPPPPRLEPCVRVKA